MPTQDSDWAQAWGSKQDAEYRLEQLSARADAGETLLPEETEEITTLQSNFRIDDLDDKIKSGTPLTYEEATEYNNLQSTSETSAKKPCKGILDGFNFKDSIKKLGNSIASTITDILKSAVNQAAQIADQVIGLVSQTIDLITDTIDDTVDGATKLVKSPKTLLKKIANGVLDTVKSIEDEIFKQIDKIRCVEKFTDETASVQTTSAETIQENLKASSPKKRKNIKENVIAKKEFTEAAKEDIKTKVIKSTQKDVQRSINDHNDGASTAVAKISPDPVPATGASQSRTVSAPSVTFSSSAEAELISVHRLYSTYNISTGDTVKVYYGSKGDVLYTEPPGGEKYFSQV